MGHGPDAVQEPGRQRPVVGGNRLHARFLQKRQGRFQAVDARHVGGPRLKAVRHIGGNFLGIGRAAGAAGNRGRQPFGKSRVQQQRADARRPQQSLMARHRQGRQAQRSEIHRQMARRLGPVETERNPIPAADLPHRRCVLDRAGHVGAVGQHHQTGIGLQSPFHVLGFQPPYGVALHSRKRHALLGQGLQGPHDGVVLHGGHHAVVPGPQKARQHQIQAPGVARRQHGMGHWSKVEQAAQPLPQTQLHHARRLCRAVDGPVHRGPHLLQIPGHLPGHLGRLGKGCGGVVQIDCLHTGFLLL